VGSQPGAQQNSSRTLALSTTGKFLNGFKPFLQQGTALDISLPQKSFFEAYNPSKLSRFHN